MQPHNANSRKQYDFPVSANHAMPDLPATAESTDGKESLITFACTAETATRSFANCVQEWKEYGIYVNSTVAKTTRPFDAEDKPKKEYNCAAKIRLATA
ncbi:hypothetical protein FOC33_16940 [Plesiomonas shigelloides]|uniref:hypothetical protein n=1 Tax=Plesiomonas shigelloides TaxID=703 RepID=UPI00143EB247|nr:hypothetical protein [Plesiomonas shigelloides]QIY07461.1 hypothetical protein FOC33_00020 [Plesiomonas shigelloides]QIY10429.1 hypothetical protein FOC33_16940 [Plesiomonas shigelloides]